MALPKRLELQRKRVVQNETRLIQSYPGSGCVRILLCYPNNYALAMSSLAWQGVYHLFNLSPFFLCHRSTLEFSSPLSSIETGQSYSDYDWVAFHFSYELDYLNFLQILQNNRIPLQKEKRSGHYPLFMAGGLCISLFPEVIAPFMDFMVQGEVECFIRQIEDRMSEPGVSIPHGRESILNLIREMKNVWIPGYNSLQGIQMVQLKLNEFPLFTPVISRDRLFKSEFLIEVSRGCPSACFFCAASHLNKPTRFRCRVDIISTIGEYLPASIRHIGLVGAALAFYPELKSLLDDLLKMNLQAHLSSLRPEIVDQELCNLLTLHQIRTVTLAPETGDDADRLSLGKKVANQQFLDCIGLLADSSSVQELKLYFMVGFGFEMEVQKIMNLVQRIQGVFRKRISLSITPFVPKKHTPFGESPFADPKKIKAIYKEFKKSYPACSTIRLSLFSIRQAALQAELSANQNYLLDSLNKNSRS